LIIVNVSNSEEPVKITIEGNDLIYNYFTVKIVVLRDKTEDEIK
jgi:hypothetical protein